MVTALEVASAVTDPELPQLTLADLGVLRDVQETDTGVVVTITPTYSGGPAMDALRAGARGGAECRGLHGCRRPHSPRPRLDHRLDPLRRPPQTHRRRHCPTHPC